MFLTLSPSTRSASEPTTRSVFGADDEHSNNTGSFAVNEIVMVH